MEMTLADRQMIVFVYVPAGFLLMVILAGMIWPRFMAWMSHLVTIVAGVVVIVSLAFFWLRAADLSRVMKTIGGDPEQVIMDRLQKGSQR